MPLQPELLADAVQPRGWCGRRHATSHDAGDGAVAVPVRGGENLASCGQDRGELQRSLRRARLIPGADGPASRDYRAWLRLRAGIGRGVHLKATVHRILCTAWNYRQEDNLAARNY